MRRESNYSVTVIRYYTVNAHEHWSLAIPVHPVRRGRLLAARLLSAVDPRIPNRAILVTSC
jgi:hypothetical protein